MSPWATLFVHSACALRPKGPLDALIAGVELHETKCATVAPSRMHISVSAAMPVELKLDHSGAVPAPAIQNPLNDVLEQPCFTSAARTMTASSDQSR